MASCLTVATAVWYFVLIFRITHTLQTGEHGYRESNVYA